jgi:RNA polymerase sigma-70 factor
MESRADNTGAGEGRREWRFPETCGPFLRRLFEESRAVQWQLSFKAFQSALARSAAKRFVETSPTAGECQDYLAALHVADLALACACAEGSERAWEEFVGQYRGYLRGAAGAILRRPPADPAAIDLADTLLTDLYGLAPGEGAVRSLFRYFHGRSSLRTWLRAVLAQRHVDSIRAGKRFDSLDSSPQDLELPRPETGRADPSVDPRREMYLRRFREALTTALAALDPRDRTRLELYYAEDRTLAEIGKEIGEHESSVSRNLERVRKELRATIEGVLRSGTAPANGEPAAGGLDDAQVALALQYAAEGAEIDLDKLFEAAKPKKTPGRNRVLES